MAGNSKRRGAMRKEGTKKGMVVGSGGQRRRALEGKGPTPPAERRPGHPARGGPPRAAKRAAKGGDRGRPAPGSAATTTRPRPCSAATPWSSACAPAFRPPRCTWRWAAPRTSGSPRPCTWRPNAGISILEVPRGDLDRIAGGALHQGVALQVPAYEYAHPDELLEAAADGADPGLIVALDGVTDPRNLGAVVRSVGAFGGHGVVVPQRRSAGMTAVAWRTSAGTAARLPVARATNLTRTLREYATAGLMIAGLDAEGSVSLDEFDLAADPLVLVVGSEGKGLSRLVKQTCDVTVSIPMAGPVESLNASVAAGVVLAEVARRRAPVAR